MILPAVIHMMKGFCEKHLIADDPYQYEELSIDALVNEWFSYLEARRLPSKVLIAEIKRRLNDPATSAEHIEILTKLTGVTK